MKTQQCRSCGAPVIWAVHETTKKRAPIDATPVEDGNVIFVHEPGMGGDPEYHVLTKTERAFPVLTSRHTNHFLSCPNAKQHKKGGR